MRNNFVENYKNLTDEELITLINKGQYELLQVIISRYNSVILSNVRKLCSESYRDDAMAEANFALYTAVKNYEPDKGSFKVFANLCIKRAVISVLKNSKRKKAIPEDMLSSIEEVEIVDANSPETIFFEKQDYRDLANNIRLELSALEFKVLQYYLEGNSYGEIGKVLEISEKSVNNALTRIRKKLKTK